MEGIVELVVRLGEEKWRIIGVYAREDLERKLELLRERVESKEKGNKLLIGGDFNTRIGEEGGIIERGDWEKDWRGRRSKDKKWNAEGRALVR